VAVGWRKPYPVVYGSVPQEVIVGEPTVASAITGAIIEAAFTR
jgi:hypothetical protein